MKTTFLALFLVLSGLSSTTLRADDAEVCNEAIIKHLNVVENSEILIKNLRINSSDITSYEIVQLQKSMSQRYASLKRLQNMYKTRDCKPRVMGDAVAIYDFALVGKSLFSDSVLRRVFMGFAKFPLYNLVGYVKEYKEYTSKSFVDSTLEDLALNQAKLPEGVELNSPELEYDPNLYALSDAAINSTTSVVAGAAKVWGYISDKTKWRQGRIKNNEEALATLKASLQPLDLVFETRNYTLSNFTIPGHWGHVGIWLGTKDQLISMGIWDQEYFLPFQKHVEAGKSIMEIRKVGMHFQGLETFINLDEIAVTRMKGVNANVKEIYKGLSEQAEKAYDFKFDARSAGEITCSELITYTYGNIKWPQTKTLFQISIRPDDIALMTMDKTSPAELILYYKGIKKKDGGGFQVMTPMDWKNVLKYKTPEEIEKEKKQRLEDETKALNEMNSGGA